MDLTVEPAGVFQLDDMMSVLLCQNTFHLIFFRCRYSVFQLPNERKRS